MVLVTVVSYHHPLEEGLGLFSEKSIDLATAPGQLPSSIRRRIRTRYAAPRELMAAVSYHHPLEEGLGRGRCIVQRLFSASVTIIH